MERVSSLSPKKDRKITLDGTFSLTRDTEYPEHRSLAASFWIKLVFILVEFSLAVAFIACNFLRRYDVAAILEWIVAFVFSFYIWSFMVDLYPAVRTRDKAMRFPKPSMRESSSSPNGRF